MWFNFFLGDGEVINIYNIFTKCLQGHDIVHPGEQFCRVDVGGQLCAHTVYQLLSPQKSIAKCLKHAFGSANAVRLHIKKKHPFHRIAKGLHKKPTFVCVKGAAHIQLLNIY